MALKGQLLNRPEINSINQTGYFQQEIQINVDPEKLVHYAIPLSQVSNEIQKNNIRQPAGHIET